MSKHGVSKLQLKKTTGDGWSSSYKAVIADWLESLPKPSLPQPKSSKSSCRLHVTVKVPMKTLKPLCRYKHPVVAFYRRGNNQSIKLFESFRGPARKSIKGLENQQTPSGIVQTNLLNLFKTRLNSKQNFQELGVQIFALSIKTKPPLWFWSSVKLIAEFVFSYSCGLSTLNLSLTDAQLQTPWGFNHAHFWRTTRPLWGTIQGGSSFFCLHSC